MGKKMIAPIVIGVILTAFYILYAVILFSIGKFSPVAYIVAIPIFCFIGLIVKVVIDRIREIQKGEEDDLSKYWLYNG